MKKIVCVHGLNIPVRSVWTDSPFFMLEGEFGGIIVREVYMAHEGPLEEKDLLFSAERINSGKVFLADIIEGKCQLIEVELDVVALYHGQLTSQLARHANANTDKNLLTEPYFKD